MTTTITPYTAKIVLSDGREFYGYGFGAKVEAIRELVFDTAMVGYQEILSDPAYVDQAVVLTYPLIGNYGVADEDYEAKYPVAGGFVVREYNDSPSNFRYTKTLSEVMEEYNIPGIAGVDTRALTRIIRQEGAQKVLFTSPDTPVEEAKAKLDAWALPTDGVSRVSCKKRWLTRTPGHIYDVVVLDLGVKYNVIRSLNRRGCNVTIVPFDTTAEEILAFAPDGIVLAGGPGNPADLPSVLETIEQLKGKVPMLGISLGHTLIGHAYGATSYKMRVGHRGSFPVKDLRTGRVKMAAENHGYSMREGSLIGTKLVATHRNVVLKDIEGMICEEDKVMTTQFCPESNPGPTDYREVFDGFIDLMKK
ncbi:carbamoyl phosphate synthase small subunit [Porphyromonas sp. COT-108 OH2963]|uniref:carbamoyl phosphate synthase small subunit n=1 Tax=Porphyromonas sp. COT-108 OH2963 TaxID=1515614 RepID=UPI00052DE223|nr:carbamoyl phosphate synthase small subunit [Porphyromonas sp. COT-108 OH2963]KGN96166.1 carbamoyl phosphate synthase small subunit [Porphyromonas sp. COT-108 OH2963]